MAIFNLIVFMGPVEGKEDEFNKWYDEDHVPHALGLTGFKSGRRFRTGPDYMGRQAPAGYAALYEIEADSIEAALDIATEGTTSSYISDAVDLNGAYAIPLTPLGPVRTND